jgi:hypothetical protein
MMMTHADTRRRLSTSGIPQELSVLRRLMDRPQRHRLLHGYPLAAAMPRVAADLRSHAQVHPTGEARPRLTTHRRPMRGVGQQRPLPLNRSRRAF